MCCVYYNFPLHISIHISLATSIDINLNTYIEIYTDIHVNMNLDLQTKTQNLIYIDKKYGYPHAKLRRLLFFSPRAFVVRPLADRLRVAEGPARVMPGTLQVYATTESDQSVQVGMGTQTISIFNATEQDMERQHDLLSARLECAKA